MYICCMFICQQVRGYPTLLLFWNSEMIAEYNGARSLEKLTKFVDEHIDKIDKGEITKKDEL